MRGFPTQVLRHVVGGGAGINDHALVGLDERCGRLANRLFFVQLMGVPGGEGELVRLGCHQACAAVGAAKRALGLKQREVAADGGNRHIDLLRQLLQRGKLHFLEVLFYQELAFFCLHVGGI